jgi:mannan endo-1,4-beta-mannosidase
MMLLWKLMYNRFTTYHKLNNLIWVWSPNIGNPISNYYPGDNYVDIVGLDGYTDGQRNWDKNSSLQNDIDEILSRSKNRVISFAELGWLPDMGWLETKRPEFVWFLCSYCDNTRIPSKSIWAFSGSFCTN